jgi:hypothetical protein
MRFKNTTREEWRCTIQRRLMFFIQFVDNFSCAHILNFRYLTKKLHEMSPQNIFTELKSLP